MKQFYEGSRSDLISLIGKDRLKEAMREMFLIRNFETRAESAYQQGKIGGFFHSYIGQEAVQVAAIQAIGKNNWWTTSYRCHALALLLGVPPDEIMAEFYGKATGNAKGRGGSMHLYSDRLLGGFGIVGGQIPVATGAAFTLKYQNNDQEISVCFLGDGAVAQGAFHESLNLASIWNLPCLYVIENNRWGMGTAVERAICNQLIAEEQAPSYKMKGYTFDGMDYLDCFAGFDAVKKEILETKRPVLVEVLTERFKGHSISDPGLYRTKDDLKERMSKDPLILMQKIILDEKIMTEEELKALDKECREIAVAAMKYAEESPLPDPKLLGEDVFAPEALEVK